MKTKSKVRNDKKNIIITILAICVLVGGLLNVFRELRDLKERETTFYSSSYLSITDCDFNANYNFDYNSSYIKVELLEDEKQIKVTPTKPGDTTLKINYVSILGENKSFSYEISVRKGLSIDIEKK